MGLWHVYYASWQMECCGTPFSVGEEVSWPLLLTDADDVLGGGWHEELAEVVGPVRDLPGDEDGSVRVLRDDTGLTVALGGETGPGTRPGDRLRQVGLLSVETHGGEWPEVSGRVRAVRVVTQEYVEAPPGSRSWEPVRGPGARRLRSVDECPKWFADEGQGSAAKGKWLMAVGVVATLEVPEGEATP
jgi:hypothetical protein